MIGGLLGAVGCGSVREDAPDDGAGDAKGDGNAIPWMSSCAAERVITTEQTYFGGDQQCLRGGWYVQGGKNGSTMPASPNEMPAAVPTTSVKNQVAIAVSGVGQRTVGDDHAYAHLTAWLNQLDPDTIGTVDVSAYTGVQFQIYATVPYGLRVTVGTTYSDPVVGDCLTHVENGQIPGCYGNPQLVVLQPAHTSADWQIGQVKFAELMSAGYGWQTPLGNLFPKQAISHIRWDVIMNAPPNGDQPIPAWSVAIRDVSFYTEP